MTELIVFRALQGLGSAGIFSTAFTVVADLFPPAERGKYQGLFGAVFGTSSVIGPWLGGLLTDNLSWRWVFYVNMPIGLIALLFIILQMPPLKPTLERKVSIDWWGSATLLLGIIPILLALSLGGQEYPWGSWQVIGLFALGAVGVAAFILVERRAKEPILPFDLFQNRTYVVGNAAALLIAGVGFFGAIIFLPIYMVVVVGVSASAAGLTVMPLTLGVVVSSFVSGQIVSRVGKYKILLLVGTAIVFVGYFLMQGLTVSTYAMGCLLADDHPRHRPRPGPPHLPPRRAERGEPPGDRSRHGQQPVLPADRLHRRGGDLRHDPHDRSLHPAPEVPAGRDAQSRAPPR